MKYFLLITLLLSPALLFAHEGMKLGSGKFSIAGGKAHSETSIDVYYHLPLAFNEHTQVLVVVPGAGRNAWSYRNSWIEASEKYNVLILAPHYAKAFYPRFWHYNLAGMLTKVKINKAQNTLASATLVTDPDSWIFNDFDRIFNYSVNKFNLSAQHYDMFGHSAGGQILHRLALFDFNHKAHRIISSNSGWYTSATFQADFPYGLNNSVYPAEKFSAAFTNKLTVMLGELDNAQETRGHLVRNEHVDVQGTFRLSRGQNFFEKAKALSVALNVNFNWNIHIVEGVGHDYVNMGKAAANYLYANQAE